jgi:hypothetical protein
MGLRLQLKELIFNKWANYPAIPKPDAVLRHEVIIMYLGIYGGKIRREPKLP